MTLVADSHFDSWGGDAWPARRARPLRHMVRRGLTRSARSSAERPEEIAHVADQRSGTSMDIFSLLLRGGAAGNAAV